MNFKHIGFLFAIFLLAGCSQTQLASHVVKKTLPPPAEKAKGNFKIGNPYKIAGKTYVPKESYNHTENGVASWYGPNFHGKQTANGEIFNKNDLTAAHRTLQLPSLVRVTNLSNGRSIILRVNDRGPFSKGRIIDVSERAAELLDFKHKGTTRVKVQVLSRESLALAEAAKRGEDTRGIEITMNENRLARAQNSASSRIRQKNAQHLQDTQIVSRRASIDSRTLQREARRAEQAPPRPLQVSDRGLSPLSTQSNSAPSTANNAQSIYVQAGSFGDQASAQSVADRLSGFGQTRVYPAVVNGSRYYRVRIGPMIDAAEASTVVANLSNAGQGDVIIVVD